MLTATGRGPVAADVVPFRLGAALAGTARVGLAVGLEARALQPQAHAAVLPAQPFVGLLQPSELVEHRAQIGRGHRDVAGRVAQPRAQRAPQRFESMVHHPGTVNGRRRRASVAWPPRITAR